MGLTRYTLSACEDLMRRELYVARESDPDGRYMDAADVDAMLSRIRAAVEAERSARWEAACWSDDAGVARRAAALGDAFATLSALLSDGGA